MNPASSEYDKQDREIIKALEDLGSFKSAYPPELLAARRAVFLARVDELTAIDEELSSEDQEIVQLLGQLKSEYMEYPPDLLAARRSAFLRQTERAGWTSGWHRLRISVQRLFSSQRTIPTSPQAGLLRISLVVGSLIAAVLLGSLFLGKPQSELQPSPSPAIAESTHLVPTNGQGEILICKPGGQTPSCRSAGFDASQDLANRDNGMARPAISKDARPSQEGLHKAEHVNDGHHGASWVSDSEDSWIKIDLGQVQTINMVSLQQGSLGSSSDHNPGQFVIEVALSDEYADGDSSHDYAEYSQVFHSEQAGFSGTVSHAESIQTWFSPVKARFVKLTFEKTGVAIEEVGDFLLDPPAVPEQPTKTTPVDAPESTPTLVHTATQSSVDTATPEPSVTWVPTDTAVLPQTATPAALPTITLPPVATATPIPVEPSPTAALPTAIPVTIQASPPSTETIVVTGSNQTLTFTCNGDAAEIRGHANTVTLLGSCSNINVKGNGNRVFWEFGSPVITIQGQDNIVGQL
jgi:hypothetical protein